MGNPKDIRWRQRFENFEKARNLLSPVAACDLDSLSDLEKEGYIQRLEMAFELAWKTMKDYLDYMELNVDISAPRAVIKEAFAAGLIEDGHVWINMAKDRNLMAHTYNEDYFAAVLGKLQTEYVPAIERLYATLKEKSMDEGCSD